MPYRTTPIVTNQYYHIYNRGSKKQPLFFSKRDYSRFLMAMDYYRFIDHPVKLSVYLSFSQKERKRIINELQKSNKVSIQILCFCLLPNHYHVLLRQYNNNGIQKYLQKIQNSYAKYFNKKYHNYGPVYQGPFKLVRIQTDEQLMHICRYIHLNPYSSYLVKNIQSMLTYRYSSITQYLTDQKGMSNPYFILSLFKNREAYREFLMDNADYQRSLSYIKHESLDQKSSYF